VPRKSGKAPATRPATTDGRKVRRPHNGKRARTVKQLILAEKAADAERERDLYGANVADVMYLRRRGFVVTRAGAGYLVGNAQCTTQQMRAKADRERRLECAAVPA
jgi:hypothetical protein